MRNLLPNDWNRIRAFYKERETEIMSEPACEWGVAAYEWEGEPGMINMTPIEWCLWADIRACNAIFYPQYPVGRFFVDFGNPVAKVAIECDGYEYHLDKGKDRDRDDELAALGWRVYRISGHDCCTEDDEETGERSRAFKFVHGIVELHRLSRNHRTISRADGWVHIGGDAWIRSARSPA